MSSVVDSWRELEGYRLEDGLRLERMHSGVPFPVFTGVLSKNDSNTPVLVRFYPDDLETGSIYDRHREAQFLQHPNLLRCFGAGKTTLPDGTGAVYGIYEQPQAFLSELVEERAFNASEAGTLCEDIVAGLAYLHSNGLVYCNLDRSTVAHAGDRWALCDFSQLRPEGTGYAAETRRLMGSVAGAPPEAFNGVVTPAWDAWSVAHLIRSVFQDPKIAKELRTATASSRVPRANVAIPEPFGSISTDCLVPDPGSRCSVQEIERKLRSARSGESPAPAELGPVLARKDESRQAADVRETEPARYYPRSRHEEHEEHGVFHHISWRALLAGAAVVLLIAFVINLVRRPSKTVTAQPTPPVAGEQQVAVAPKGDVRPTPVDQSPVPDATADRSTRSRATDAFAAGQTSVGQIDSLVRRWADAFQHRDMKTEIGFYAPRLDRFYQARNVPLSLVERTKTAALTDAGVIRAYDIDNVETRFDKRGVATVTFDKTWDFAGRMKHTGKVRGELKLQKRDGRWQIVSERDLKVYRQSRTRG